ncbi:MAG: putative transporter [Alphaproteobacteria bacterium ADurb.Bin438]|nr:MAG: putative transporter [Alphaproteobacteria bacterium ADurb.Bin438]
MVGNDKKAVEKIKIMPMFLGMALGVLLGVVPFILPGGDMSIKLGLAGGPLIMAIILARVGNLGPIIWYLPQTVNFALREFGLVLFLGVIGITSGPKFFEILAYGDGLKWVMLGLTITLIPAIIMGIVARFFFKENFLTIAGLISGSYMNTSALAFSNGLSPSQAATMAYASVYPLATLLTILVPQIVVFFVKLIG